MDEEPITLNTPSKGNGKAKKVLIMAGIILVSFSVGFWLNQGINMVASIYGKGFLTESLPQSIGEADFSRFNEAIKAVEEKYIGVIDYNKLVEGAIAGAIASLEDPFSTYFTKQDLAEFNDELSGTFEGIGAEIGVRDKKLVVIAPVDGTPAKKAGLKPGDWIKFIDDKPTEYMTADEAVGLIRGKGGTEVKLSIVREGQDKVQEFKIKRQLINVKSVSYEKKDGNIAYIRIMRFDADTATLFSNVAKQAKKDGVKGVILDLRSNPGGYLDTAIAVAGDIIPDQVVVLEEQKNGQRKELKADNKGGLADISLVVLIDEGSASASEILAGAIRDNGRGILIGQTTFGKGTVQEMEQFGDGAALKITVAHWLTPKGTVIDKNGLKPDIEVKLGDVPTLQSGQGLKDEQLERAVEEIKKIIK